VINFGDFVEATSFEDYPYKIKIIIDQTEDGENLDNIKNVGLTYSFFSTRNQRLLATSRLLREILNTFEDKVNPSLNFEEKYRVYSAHDITILSVLTSLKLTNHTCMN